MKRRLLIALPGVAAFAAARAWGQTEETDAPSSGVLTHVSKKALTKHSGSKSAYKVPKNATKQAKYLSSLTVLL